MTNKIEIQCPELPENIQSAKLSELKVVEEQIVQKDQILCAVETDKVVLEVTAPQTGKVSECSCALGDELKTGQTIMLLSSLSDEEMSQLMHADNQAAENEFLKQRPMTPLVWGFILGILVILYLVFPCL